METGMPVSCFASFGESAIYVPKSPECNHLDLLSHQRSLIARIDVSMPFDLCAPVQKFTCLLDLSAQIKRRQIGF